MADDTNAPLLPLSTTEHSGGLRPLSAATLGQPEPTRGKVAESEDPVEKHLREFPTEPAKADAVADVAPIVDKPAVDAPKDATPPAVEPVVSKDATPPAKSEAVVDDKKPIVEANADIAKPVEAVKAETPASVEPKRYAPEEKFVLAVNGDGSPVEWTRAQVVAALQERERFTPLAKEAETYKNLFGMDAASAVEAWKPVLERIASSPAHAAVISNIIDDPAKADYLAACDAHYDQERIAGTVPAAAAPKKKEETGDPVLRAQVAELQRDRDTRRQRDATDQVNREIAEAIRAYPFLATDRSLLVELVQTGAFLESQDAAANIPEHQRRGIPAALAAKRSIYDAVSIARGAAQVSPQPAVVPATLGTSGAAPGGTRQPNDSRPRKFDDASDGVDDWLRNHPA